MPEAPATSSDAAGTPTAAAKAEPARAEGERVAVITGGRLCSECGFNLQGQMVVREPAYQLLIARCPECGTVAPLQEFPPLAKWSRRWAMLLAVLWFAMVLGLALGTAAVPLLMASGLSWSRAQPLTGHIAEAWQPAIRSAIDAVRAADGSADSLSPGMLALAQQYAQWYTTGQYTEAQIEQWIQQGSLNIDRDWWEANKARVLASAPSAGWEWVRRQPLDDWTVRLLFSALFGAMWSAILLHLRVRGRLLAGALIMAGAAIMLWAARPDAFTGWAMGWAGGWAGQANTWAIAQAAVWPRLAVLCLVLFAIPFFAGLLFGRPVVRLLARAVLPPRLCHAIAPLWFCDGKRPPRLRRSQSR